MRSLVSRASFVTLFLLWAAQVLPGDPGKDKDADRIAELIKQLGDDAFASRDAASRALVSIGEPALPALRKALMSPDAEVRRRAEDAIHTIILAASKSNSTGMQLVLIEPGEFPMGSPNNEGGRKPDEVQHKVRITRPFLLGAYEVTQDEYKQVTKTSPSWFAPTGGGKDKVAKQETGRFPVESVTWFDAVEFCNLLSKKDGYPPVYKLEAVKREGDSIRSATVTMTETTGYRLPTEAEWEYACRAGTTGTYHYGVGITSREANLRPGPSTGYGVTPPAPALGRSAKVGSYKPSAWDLYDMHGNVAEWCADWYDKDYYGNSPGEDPKGPDRGNHRVLRGGSWMVNEGNCRSASRFGLAPDEAKEFAGFRVARTP